MHISSVFSPVCSGWRTSAFLRALTAPNTHRTWSQQPPSQTQCRRSPCLTPSTLAWSSLRSPAPKISTMLCSSVPRRSQERDNLKESCRWHTLTVSMSSLHLVTVLRKGMDNIFGAAPGPDLSFIQHCSRCCMISQDLVYLVLIFLPL